MVFIYLIYYYVSLQNVKLSSRIVFALRAIFLCYISHKMRCDDAGGQLEQTKSFS